MKLQKLILLPVMAFMFHGGFSQTISVDKVQDLNFGEFYFSENSGGTVTVSSQGIWSSTGDIYELNATHQPAAFYITTNSPTPVRVQIYSPENNFISRNGKKTSIQWDTPYPEIIELKKGVPIQVLLGGTLTITPESVGSSGKYSENVLLSFTVYNE